MLISSEFPHMFHITSPQQCVCACVFACLCVGGACGVGLIPCCETSARSEEVLSFNNIRLPQREQNKIELIWSQTVFPMKRETLSKVWRVWPDYTDFTLWKKLCKLRKWGYIYQGSHYSAGAGNIFPTIFTYLYLFVTKAGYHLSAGFWIGNESNKVHVVTYLSWCGALLWQSLLLGWEFDGPSAVAKCREKEDFVSQTAFKIHFFIAKLIEITWTKVQSSGNQC